MFTSLRRIALGAAATAVMTVAVGLPASAASTTPPSGSNPFVVKVFPHETAMVRFSDSWGAPRSGGRHHEGTDIMSPKGTWVVAVADGIVERLGWNRLSGWNIKIQHADGWSSLYLHLNNDTPGTDDGEGGPEAAFAEGLEVGSFVEAGQLIGYVGDSGNAEGSGSHTHFELHIGDHKVDPYPYLMDALDRKIRSSEMQRAME